MNRIIEARGITRIYPGGTVANDGVSLTVNEGEVHAVVGENGAGKSTLMKILFGIEKPDEGTLVVDGQEARFDGPKDAIDRGVGMVFQHFSLVPSFSVYENVVLGSEPAAGVRFDRAAAIKRVRELSEQFRLRVDPEAQTRALPVGQQQRVEILKALYREAKILILDEPTAVLAPQEVEELFTAIRSLVKQGRTVIFIAHKLPEVLAISDRITVMRAGKTVGEVASSEVTEPELASMMVGREVALRVDRSTHDGPRAITVEGLTLKADTGVTLAEDLSLNVHEGEIVGLVGVEGNGQAELLEAVAGLRSAAKGDIRLKDRSLLGLSVLERRGMGVSSIPEDRLAEGLAVNSSTAENLVATRLSDPRFVRKGLLDRAAIRENARTLIERFSIRVGGPEFKINTLSGGNMQKVVVARELAEQPELLLVNQPTRGVDLGATQFIWKSITDARDGGAAVLLSSADLSELLALSDRLVVFYKGRIVAAFHNSEDLTAETLGSFMLGAETQDEAVMKAALR
ncbi:ABC transporter ATP-binding protein [Pelagovum pacificum]|uniref:ABC transporter ATP-binding protein n=1 Tax=Pelagovum pacificum TaxID=2588711 RepID=A0A5C5GFB6_9RHOB|nr:ABC transporter ATP-binding protein [Pelagovum pacificum]QQA44217.1 ABC transporter ATP-binding protein [Pelagovum pacificum]TNY32661.1 ABC transporter ATP-binding protein [Pelagovum pacificum]